MQYKKFRNKVRNKTRLVEKDIRMKLQKLAKKIQNTSGSMSKQKL